MDDPLATIATFTTLRKDIPEKSLKLVYIKYRDHVLFRNMDPVQIKPAIREAIGWLIGQTQEALWICFDKSIEILPFEKPDPASGLVILRSDILEIKEIE